MALWLVFAALSAGVLTALLRPLLRPLTDGEADAAAVSGETAVYRDQLTEIEAEFQRGLLGADEAEAARREIARRLLASVPERPVPEAQSRQIAHSAPDLPSSPSARRSSRLAAGLALLLPMAAIAIYLQTGVPYLPAQPFAARAKPAPVGTPAVDETMARLIAAVEGRLRENPEDKRGWDVIAPVYLRLGRVADAAEAYRHAVRLNGESMQRLAGLAEATIMSNDGRITPPAREALQGMLKLEPGNPQARFWLAHAKEQDGRPLEAAADYEQLLAQAPPDAAWRKPLEERLAALRSAAGASPAASAGPTDGDIEAAKAMTPEARAAMIDAMVSGLASRLAKDGHDLAGWQRLIKALVVMGRKDEAVEALGRARKAFDGEPQAQSSLGDFARTLGLGS